MIGRLGLIMLDEGRGRGRGGSLSLLQGPLKVSDGGLEESEGSGDVCELALRAKLHQGEIRARNPAHP